MTEIQWLCDILLNFKLPKEVKAKFISRIGEVEGNLTKPYQPIRPIMPQTIQAPSTQKLMDQQVLPVATSIPAKIDKETGSAMVNNGDGTFGKRKW